MRIYLASSWRNKHHGRLLEALRHAGHVAYDFKQPRPGERGFAWSEIDPAWQTWTPSAFAAALEDPLAAHGYAQDMRALQDAEAVVLLLPCGRSAHLEAGWAAGKGKPLLVFLPVGEPFEPELMYRMAAKIVTTTGECLTVLAEIGRGVARRQRLAEDVDAVDEEDETR